MTQIAIQFLEPGPGVDDIAPADAREKLRAAFQRMPISAVLLGWNLTEALVHVCREETTRAGAALYLWHPLLTGDGLFFPRPEWRTEGISGEPVPGFRDTPEITFVCPNRPGVRDAVLEHLRQVIARDDYDGVFLDRIRYPSPALDPSRWLACFCDDCHRVAGAAGLDLEAVRRAINEGFLDTDHVPAILRAILGTVPECAGEPDIPLLGPFLDFRQRSVTRLVRDAAALIRGQGLAVGLDCFALSLARMVGQELGALDAHADWTKVMVYGHTLGPAGLPFEILALVNWLVKSYAVSESRSLGWLSRATELGLPSDRAALQTNGLAPLDLASEVTRARAAGIKTLLAGIELVEIDGIASLNPSQIEADLRGVYAAGADGLVLSWDLWHIPLERLDMVREIWVS